MTNALLSGQGSGSLSEAPLAPPVNTESSHSCGLRDFTSRGVSCSYLGPGGLKPSFFVPFSEREMLEDPKCLLIRISTWKSMNISGFPGEQDGEVVQHVFLSEQTKFWEKFF